MFYNEGSLGVYGNAFGWINLWFNIRLVYCQLFGGDSIIIKGVFELTGK
ncbi:MAG: hypothetical protein ACOX3R_15705 [Desulfitobacteriia bacterium]